MKRTLFIILSLYSIQTSAISFNVCISEIGKRHITNLPLEVFTTECNLKKNYRDYIVHQNYQELYLNLKQNQSVKKRQTSENIKNEFEQIKNKVVDLLDADKALDNLVEKSRERDNAISNYLKRQTLLDELIKELKE